MTMILVKNKKVLSISHLQLAVLKSIYAPKTMTLAEEAAMQHSIVEWNKYLQNKRDYGRMNAIDEENMMALEEMAWLINKDNEGRLDNRKAMFKEHDIDYKKFHRIQGSVTEKDRIRAQAELENLMEKNPDEYK